MLDDEEFQRSRLGLPVGGGGGSGDEERSVNVGKTLMARPKGSLSLSISGNCGECRAILLLVCIGGELIAEGAGETALGGSLAGGAGGRNW